jgi:hypothetical protein
MKRIFSAITGIFTLTAAVALLAPLPAHAQFGTNLVVNSGAEAGPGSTGDAVASIPGWTASTPAPTVVLYGTGDYPSLASPGPVDRGIQFFGGGNSANTSISQLIDLNFASTNIDAGTAAFDLSGYLGGFSNQDDRVSLTLTFLDSSSQSLGSSVLGPVLAVDRIDTTGLLLRQSSGVIPAGARSATTTLDFTRSAGTSNDGYADNISLVVTNQSAVVPESGTLALLGANGLATLPILLRRRTKK